MPTTHCFSFSNIRDIPLIIADNENDSIFVRKQYPYDFDSNEYPLSTIVAESSIRGKTNALEAIMNNVRDSITTKYEVLKETLVMSVVIDEQGIVRGAVILTGFGDIDIARYALRLFKHEQYIPAYRRNQPITYFIPFILRSFPAQSSQTEN